MTCIVGLVHQDKVYIGGDSLGSNSLQHSARRDEKVFQVEDMLFGFAASYRAGQVVRYWFKKPKHDKGVSVEEYLHREIIPAIRTLMSTHGTGHKKEEVEQTPGQFLLGYRGRLFRLDYDYQVGEALCQYDSIGSGSSVALGSLYSTRSTDDKPETRILEALRAAETHARGVGGPFGWGVV